MTRTKKAVRSIDTPGAPKRNPSGLPYGTGSMQIRGNVWWTIYRDTEGRTIQENTRTADADVARRLLATRALETARAKVAALEAILNDGQESEPTTGAGNRQGGKRSGGVSTKSGRKAGKGTK